MSEGSTSGERGKAALGRAAKFKNILRGRSKQFPVLLVMIVVLAVATAYSLITGMM
jgi:hypothetical protein